jgi:hypothetical protein
VSTERDIKALIKVLERIIASFKSDEVLSDFERGQLDGLRWAVQLAQEVE